MEQDATKRKGNKQTALNFLVKNTAVSATKSAQNLKTSIEWQPKTNIHSLNNCIIFINFKKESQYPIRSCVANYKQLKLQYSFCKKCNAETDYTFAKPYLK